MVTSDQVFRSQILYRCIHIQHIYHRAKFECSSFSSLANTKGGGLKGSPPVLQGTKKPGWNRAKMGVAATLPELSEWTLRGTIIGF